MLHGMSHADSLTVNQQRQRQTYVGQMTDGKDETWSPAEMSVARRRPWHMLQTNGIAWIVYSAVIVRIHQDDPMIVHVEQRQVAAVPQTKPADIGCESSPHCGTLFRSSCAIQTSPMDCSDDS